jgi:hypothetical protein
MKNSKKGSESKTLLIKNIFIKSLLLFFVVFSDPPVVHLNVQVVKVPLGEKVTLNCSVFGSPSPQVFWKRRDKIIKTGQFLAPEF